MIEFKLPEVGENITTGHVVSIFVAVGDTITKDQDLLELETDKASLPVPAPCNGVIKEILIQEGTDVNIGQVIMKIEETTSDAPADAPAETPKEETPAQVQAPTAPKAQPRPAAVAPRPMAGTKAHFDPTVASKDIPAAPTVRRLAREIGLDISQVPGTGPGGRVSKDDVKAFAKQLITGQIAFSSGPPKKPLPDFTKFGSVKRETMTKIRKVTAQHMSHCWNTIPHVTQFDKADTTELETLRKEVSTTGRKITVTSFLLKVMAKALKEFPQFNCSIDMDTHEIIYKDYCHIGVAVDTDRGLLVPVIRDIDKKSIEEITDELTTAAERARAKKTALDELQGGSMTLTNLGGIGGHAFTPIVNWPEVCILGVSRGGFEPVWDKESNQFTPRMKLPLSLSYDHRIIDGADAARFLRWICKNLEGDALKDVVGA